MNRFIYILFANRDNDYNWNGKSNSRTTRICTKGKTSNGTTSGTGKELGRIQERSKFSRWTNWSISGMLQVRSKSKQCARRPKAQASAKISSKIQEGLNRLLFFFLYNPQILFTLIYIDTMFSDELMNFNIVQLQYLFDKQTFINTGVV